MARLGKIRSEDWAGKIKLDGWTGTYCRMCCDIHVNVTDDEEEDC
jgi:hypothetical protein